MSKSDTAENNSFTKFLDCFVAKTFLPFNNLNSFKSGNSILRSDLIGNPVNSSTFLEMSGNISLEYDLPFKEDLCGTCMACIEACPTKALDEYRIESEKCISYNTIENRGKLFSDDTELSRWIYGCDICQEVCPWNEKFSQSTHKKDFKPRSEIINWGNKEWENLDEQEFRKLFRGSAAKRTKFSGLKRNIQFNGKDA